MLQISPPFPNVLYIYPKTKNFLRPLSRVGEKSYQRGIIIIRLEIYYSTQLANRVPGTLGMKFSSSAMIELSLFPFSDHATPFNGAIGPARMAEKLRIT